MSRRVTVRVPGAHRDGAPSPEQWLTASLTLDASRARRVERGGRLRTLVIDDDRDLLIVGVRAACEAAGRTLPDAFRCRVVSEIPIGAGQGASAAAIVAGIIGARALFDLPLDGMAVQHLAESLDGSPEQVRAAFGAHTCRIEIVCDDEPAPVA